MLFIKAFKKNPGNKALAGINKRLKNKGINNKNGLKRFINQENKPIKGFGKKKKIPLLKKVFKENKFNNNVLKSLATRHKPKTRYKRALYAFNEKGFLYFKYYYLIFEKDYNGDLLILKNNIIKLIKGSAIFNSLFAKKKMPGVFFSRSIRQRKLRITKDLRDNMGKFKKSKIKKKRFISFLRRPKLIITAINIEKKFNKNKLTTYNRKKIRLKNKRRLIKKIAKKSL